VPNNRQPEFGTAPAAEECKNAAQLLFLSCLTQVSPVTMSRPSLRTVAPPPCLPLDIKDLLKEDERFFDGGLMEGFLMGDGLIGGILERMMLWVGC
jgi:hypothetical protein